MEFWSRTILADAGPLLSGLCVTLSISAIAFVVAASVGLGICIARSYLPALRPLFAAYIAFCRNTPIFIQLLWVAYAWYDLLGWPRDVFTAAWVALALQSSGYLAETFRAGIDIVPAGQVEAAHALGIRRLAIWRRIVMPQMLLAIAPSLMNQLIVIIKCSTLVSVIAVPDLMFQALRLTGIWGDPVPIMSFVAVIFIAVIMTLSALSKNFADLTRARLQS
jgi:polar amino acid transport system permease protein